MEPKQEPRVISELDLTGSGGLQLTSQPSCVSLAAGYAGSQDALNWATSPHGHTWPRSVPPPSLPLSPFSSATAPRIASSKPGDRPIMFRFCSPKRRRKRKVYPALFEDLGKFGKTGSRKSRYVLKLTRSSSTQCTAR